MPDIYVLECEDGNYYVGKTSNGEKRLNQHIKGRGAEWTKMHKPKKIVQYYTNATDADERKVTDQMIKKYGARKVRGAGLTKRKMSKKEIDNLNKKIGFTGTKAKKSATPKKKTSTKKSTTYTCSRCGRQGHNRTQCYAKTSVTGGSVSSTKKSSTYKKKSTSSKKYSPKKTTSSKKTWKPKSTTKKSTRSSSKKPTRSTSRRGGRYRR